ncbi:hypothetical protein AADZ90_001110 [Aestuariibius sp. 2305UL40-4]|uniref:hypothetical protein n=1 Tax=Aestuariibius violaceus TaxID=3234132 RepID=UPI00345EFE0D
MFRFLIPIALAATPALASDQLAQSLGVDPGAYSVSELATLKAAMEEHDHQKVDLILGGGAIVSTQGRAGAGQAQLAAQLGVAPGAYDVADLIELRVAYEENDDQRVRKILSGGSVVSTQDSGVAGHDQMARQLGVDPADYTNAQIAAMYMDEFSD